MHLISLVFTSSLVLSYSTTKAVADGKAFYCKSENSLLFKGQCVRCLSRFQKTITDNKVIGANHIHNNTATGAAPFNCKAVSKIYWPVKANEHPLLPKGQKRSGLETNLYFKCPTSSLNFKRLAVNAASETLEGKVLNVVTIQRHPFSKVNENSTQKFSGVIFEFLEALQVKYNFTMNIFLPPDGNWGSKDKHGNWNGMIGLVKARKADVGAASFSITLDRTTAVDFTAAFHQEPTGILIPAPVEGEKLTITIRPLSKEVWIVLLITIGILAPSFYVFHTCSLSISGQGIKDKSFFNTIVEILLFITGSMVQESVVSPVNKTTKFLIGVWWMGTLVIANTYVAFLVSYLSVPKLYNLVNSLEELSQQRYLKWTFRKGTAHQALFQSETSSGVFKAIGDAVSENQLVSSDYEGINKVIEDRYAFIKEKSFLDVALSRDFIESKKCRLTLTKETFFTVGIALVVPKNAEHREVLDYEISNTLATGIFDKWKHMHWPKEFELWCTDAASYIITTRPRTRKLKLDDVQGAYLLLLVGIVFATTSFIIEQIFRCSKLRVSKILWVSPHKIN